ncbi:MAG: ribonuclease PH [Candidatus Pacebacteria bacterium]|nr:ribonuclease PH [Candidatus Paceibacterota bacterium]
MNSAPFARPSGRDPSALRQIQFEPGFSKHAEGSCLVSFGDTRVLCTASIEDKVPPFLRGTNRGWVTAEYGMLPRSTHSRMDREASRGKQSGRTHEIQRLIGRSLRMATDLGYLGERQIKIDCDVIQADGGTRTAAISGAWVALYLAGQGLVESGVLKSHPVVTSLAAISCGIWHGVPLLDLDYLEDSDCDADANFVITQSGDLIEVQLTAEKQAIGQETMMSLLALARAGVATIIGEQFKACGIAGLALPVRANPS